MKMLLIVFRESMIEQVHALLKEHEVNAFTELHNVAGKGATGPTVQFFLTPGANSLILAAVPEQLASRLIDGFTRYRAEHEMRRDGEKFSLHIFVLACEQAL
ncbi:P-II family nitrogen regulator [Petrachloros mirabilis]